MAAHDAGGIPYRTLGRTGTPMSDEERSGLLAKTASAAGHGEFELFKTTSIFDATTTNPEWLGEEPERVQHAAPQ